MESGPQHDVLALPTNPTYMEPFGAGSEVLRGFY